MGGSLRKCQLSWEGLKSLTRVVSWSELTVSRSVRNHLRWNMRRSYWSIQSCISQTEDAVLFPPLSSLGIPDLKETRVGSDYCLRVWISLCLWWWDRLTGSSHHSCPQSSDCASQSNTQGVQNVRTFNGLKTEMPFTLKVRKVCDSNRTLRLQYNGCIITTTLQTLQLCTLRSYFIASSCHRCKEILVHTGTTVSRWFRRQPPVRPHPK